MALRLIELTVGGDGDAAPRASTLENISVPEHWQSVAVLGPILLRGI